MHISILYFSQYCIDWTNTAEQTVGQHLVKNTVMNRVISRWMKPPGVSVSLLSVNMPLIYSSVSEPNPMSGGIDRCLCV